MRGPGPAEPFIRVEGVRFAYGGKEGPSGPVVLEDVNLLVYPGQMVAIVGRNGSGKSTLARHLNGLLLPQQGRVLVGGLDTRDEVHLWEIRRQVGMVFQNPDNQLVATTVEEDVAFGPENLGLPPEEIRRRVDRALELVGMSAYRRSPPHRLSGGQKQRVAIAGVLAMRPACIVLDEPTSMLDPRGQREVLATLQELRRTVRVAVVYITHRMEEAAGADWLVVMERGRIVMEGPPREVFDRAAQLEELDLEVPPVVRLARELRRGGLPLRPGILTADELVNELCPSGCTT